VSEIAERYLKRALELAKEAWGETHPNPMVGAVIVENDELVSEGYHARAGEPHAEIVALDNLGRLPCPDAELYVTLEPCSTSGQTGSCVEAIIKAGFNRVVVGALDPNPVHAGRGLDKLREAGIEVCKVEGPLAEACLNLNLIFNYQIVRKQPLFALKLAVTKDNKIAEHHGQSSVVTGEEARADVMRWRRLFPAIAIGAGTVSADNPTLTARLPSGDWCPRRIIIDGKLSSVPEAARLPNVYSDAFSESTLVVTGEASSVTNLRRARLIDAGVTLHELPLDSVDGFSYQKLREILAEEGLTGIYFEGGAKVAHQMLREKAVDYLFWYQSPKTFPNADAVKVPPLADFTLPGKLQSTRFGEDSLTCGPLNFSH
jgi:diaminohydroxyphosphoribosylaminopyrimidine deaminase / 5-amino-6-(5-phosphoribosylamino)uracil reductase